MSSCWAQWRYCATVWTTRLVISSGPAVGSWATVLSNRSRLNRRSSASRASVPRRCRAPGSCPAPTLRSAGCTDARRKRPGSARYCPQACERRRCRARRCMGSVAGGWEQRSDPRPSGRSILRSIHGRQTGTSLGAVRRRPVVAERPACPLTRSGAGGAAWPGPVSPVGPAASPACRARHGLPGRPVAAPCRAALPRCPRTVSPDRMIGPDGPCGNLSPGASCNRRFGWNFAANDTGLPRRSRRRSRENAHDAARNRA